jgi:hypothetical protein
MSGQIIFDQENHKYYWVNGDMKEVPSVSEILRAGGFAKDYSEIPVAVLEKARRRGQAVHERTAIIDAGGDPDDNIDQDIYEDVMRMCDGWEKFKKDYNPEILEIEKVTSYPLNAPRYAGTFDRLMVIDGVKVMGDLKTSGTMPENIGIQLMLYGMGECLDCSYGNKLLGVRLDKNGNYHLWWGAAQDEVLKTLAQNAVYKYHHWDKLKTKDRRRLYKKERR